ncbi:MAG: 1-hydroxycarotenoid 3,4-desaturase CrtD [Pseudomonadota bacterium]
MPNALVIGAGVGGLAAAIELAAAGQRVTVLERESRPGGKMRRLPVAGQGVDAGPTVFTMRWVFDELLASAGTMLEDELGLHKADVLARHAWTQGGELDLFANIDESAQAIEAFAGAADADSYRDFCRRSAAIYDTLREPFIASSRPGMFELVKRVGYDRLDSLWRTAPFQSLWNALGKQFADQRLRQLFGRYATYVGSSPLQAPATLMLIAHVEQNGVWLVEGGMEAVAHALMRVGERLGVEYRFNEGVRTIDVRGDRVVGVFTERDAYIDTKRVVFNGDASALATGMLGPDVCRAARVVKEKHRALSAITFCLLGKVSGFDLHYHNVFFAQNYPREFRKIFDERSIVDRPTVYLCAQDRREGCQASTGPEPLLLLINAPADGDRVERSEFELSAYRDAALQMLSSCGCEITFAKENAIATDPHGFAKRFPGSGGSLYGRANHGPFASFARAGARTPIRGLYLAGGSVHPGAGVPMSAMSGRLAAAAVLSEPR